MSLLATVRDLHRQKARERRRLALAEGVRLVEEMVTCAVPCKGVVAAPSLGRTPRGVALRQALEARGVPVEDVDDATLARAASTEHPQGIIAVYQPPSWDERSCDPASGHPLVVLDAVQDPGNVGTIARTTLAFGGTGLLALPGTVDLANPKVVRGAMGALFALPNRVATLDDITEIRRRTGAAVWVAAQPGDRLDGAPASPVIVVLGNEGAGIDDAVAAIADRRVAIPIAPRVESLNVAVAAGILLHALTS